MENFIAAVIAATITLFFVRGYLRKLAAGHKPTQHAQGAKTAPAKTAKLMACPRCTKQIAEGSTFCSACGAALAMWEVHRAPVAVSGAASGVMKPLINASLCVGCGTCIDACPEKGTLVLDGGKAILANAQSCVGHAKCAEVCPTQAISLSAGGLLRTVKVPLVKENFETNVPGIYIVGELGGMGLIKTAINEGKLVMDYIGRAPQSAGSASGNAAEYFDVAIVGSGPAGLSASLSAHQLGMKYLTLEQGDVAATIRNYPRHKFLMAEPVQIPLYGSLYVADTTKESLLSVWETIISNTGVKIQTQERVEQVQRNGHGFYVTTLKGKYLARHVVLAMGRRGSPRKLDVPGEDLAKVSYRLIEAESYKEKNLLVVGGGDSAVEAALALSRSGNNRVALSYRGAEFNRLRERNRQSLAEAETSGQLRVIRGSVVTDITETAVTLKTCAGPQQLSNDFVFVLIGGESPEDFLRRTGISIVEKSLAAAPAYS